jgi:acyl-CoA synthetase (AMP-forming)/AMP-acid ligase II
VSDWSFAAVWDGVALEAAERDAIVCGARRATFAELADRATRLAAHFAAAGLQPGDRVAIDMVNRPEYLETFYAALKLGCVPVNINYRYGPEEIHYLLEDSGARVVVHEAEFGAPIRMALHRIPKPWRPATLEIGDHYEQTIAAADPSALPRRAPSGDDLIFLYTGGTTGMPKGVMWRNDDLYVALWQMARPGTEPPDPIAGVRAGKRAATVLPACPLMHGTGLFITLSTLSGGGTVVLIDRPGLEPHEVWDAVERESVQVLTIVGDAFARPLLAALDEEPDRWKLDSLRAITSSGVTWSPETKRGLLGHLPSVTLLDSLGASEGLMTRNETKAGSDIRPARFAVNDKLKVVTPEGTEVMPGSDEKGLLAVGGRIPLGYHNDPEKTDATFKVIDGVRYSLPGDWASVDADGTIRLLGRGSACINTGGEKVYPEEIELVLRSHPSVFDCVVLGVPDERLGEMVVALIQPSDDATFDEQELRAYCRSRTAGYKTPKRMLAVDTLQRSAAGKADYKLLREMAAKLVLEGG